MGKRIEKALVLAIVLSQLSFTGVASAATFDLLFGKNSDADTLVTSIDLNTKSYSFENFFWKSNRPSEDVTESKPEFTIISESIRKVTAYNVGDIYQNDDTPCTGAYSKVDLCNELEKGIRICAANFVPLHTMLRIFTADGESFECIVWDRMNSRFPNRVDVAMSKSEKSQARQFGLQSLKVQILERK